jgi:hypothetical protein
MSISQYHFVFIHICCCYYCLPQKDAKKSSKKTPEGSRPKSESMDSIEDEYIIEQVWTLHLNVFILIFPTSLFMQKLCRLQSYFREMIIINLNIPLDLMHNDVIRVDAYKEF